MTGPSTMAQRRRRLWLVVFAALTATLMVAGRDDAGAAAGVGAITVEPVLKGAAAGAERLFGATPGETAGEVWGVGTQGLVRYTPGGGWEPVAPPLDSDGTPLPGFGFEPEGGALAGRTTTAGGVVVAGTVRRGSASRKALVVRDPAGVFKATPEPSALVLTPEEQLFEAGVGGLLFAAVEEPDGATGAFLVPRPEAGTALGAVLHYDGSEWSREPICIEAAPTCTEPPPAFEVLGIDASGPGNAWLLARGAVTGDGVELFRREEGEWRPQALGGPLGSLFAKGTPLAGVRVKPRAPGQPLTVTSTGLWADATIEAEGRVAEATFYFSGGQILQSWCDAPPAAAALCGAPLGSELTGSEGRSFAWPAGASEPYGRRAITGVGQGAMLILTGTGFERVPLAGIGVGEGDGAALTGVDEGWLGSSQGPLRLTREAEPSTLRSWPLPFRRPLTAIAPQPGKAVGSLGSEAIAVGDQGQVGRYVPGQGWVAESLLNSAGVRATPRLRAVAWPEPGFAYAVGDGGAMWLWRASTDLWEPDPGAPANLLRGNFTGIAFDPAEPSRGYAVGKQGLLLRYGHEWEAEALPVGVNPEVNFTSIAFAGNEAIAAYRFPVLEQREYTGGLLVNEGTGWRTEEVPGATGAPVLVAGLPDGGAVVAYQEGRVFERNAPGGAWAPVSQSLGGYPVALAAFREAGTIRAAVSVSPGTPTESKAVGWLTDSEQVLTSSSPDQPPLLTPPYGLGSRGYLERQTPSGWRDEEHGALPSVGTGEAVDLPREPDPLLALLISPEGGEGWAVGGTTGENVSLNPKPTQTASIMRYGASAAPPAGFRSAPIAGSGAYASLAIGGEAECASVCADRAGDGIGPEVWLPAAVRTAATVPGVRGFLYTGPGVASLPGEPETRLGTTLSGQAFAREEEAYAQRLGGTGALPVFPAPTSTDLDRAGSLATFGSAFAPVTPIPEAELERGYYAFEFPDAGGVGEGPVRVIVLDYAAPTLGEPQECWLAQQLEGAKLASQPAVVVGNRDLGGRVTVPTRQAGDAAEVTQILVTGTSPGIASAGCPLPAPGAASAYFFDFPEENRDYSLNFGGASIPAFGSGTLGYVSPKESSPAFLGAGGFLVASIGPPNAVTDIAPVTVRLIPVIGELAMEALDGTLLRRSSTALFSALARRQRAGGRCVSPSGNGGCQTLAPDPYQPIPSRCRGTICSSGILPEYRFTSSDPEVANFVAVDPASGNPRAVLLGTDEKPIPDPTSGLLCAFNAGTTDVSIEAGGLAYEETVKVLPGSVQRPCGTVPLKKLGAPPAPTAETPPAPAPTTGFAPTPTSLPPPAPPASPLPAPAPVPVSIPAVPKPVPPPAAPTPLSLPFFAPTPALTPVVVIVPPPPPPAVEPTPPSGTSPVTQPAVSPEPEEQDEVAFDVVHHAVAQRPARRPSPAQRYAASSSGHGLPNAVLPGLFILAAIALAGAARPRLRRSPEPAFQRNRPQRRPFDEHP